MLTTRTWFVDIGESQQALALTDSIPHIFCSVWRERKVKIKTEDKAKFPLKGTKNTKICDWEFWPLKQKIIFQICISSQNQC